MRTNSCIIIISLVALLFSWSGLKAQDLSEDFNSVFNAYNGKDMLSLTVTVKIYSKTGKKTVEQVSKLKKQGNKFLYKMDGTDMLITENNLLLVSHSNKNIMRRKIDQAERTIMQQQSLIPQNDTTEKAMKHDSVQFRLNNQKEKLYTLYDSKSVVYKTDMQFDAETHTLTKVVYYYKSDAKTDTDKIEILYSEDANPAITEATFSEDQYIVLEGTKYKVVPEYQTYKLNIVNP